REEINKILHVEQFRRLKGLANIQAFTLAQQTWIHMRRKINFILACLHPPWSPTREAVCRSSGKTRHGAYLKHTQNIMLQHQGEDPTWSRPTHPLSAALTLQQCLSGDSKRGTTSRLTGGSLLPPVYSEAWGQR
ncbi:hypothetical protein TNCV_3247021, partial [Trichonephila clavipes]